VKGYKEAPSGSVDRARLQRKNATDAEKRLWRALRETFPHAKFRRQSLVAPYYPDFLSFRHMLITEVDGGQHSEEVDALRTRLLESKGYRVIRFWNNAVLTNTDGVLREIGRVLAETSR
jgi:very-short-patch-repair endonuclease